MDEYIRLANGRTFQNSHVLESSGNLFLYIQDSNETLKTVFDDLYKSAGTATIIEHRFGEDHIYTGYTDLYSVRDERGVQLTASLRKGD